MNVTKFTQKSIEAVNRCTVVADDYRNQELVPAHLMYSLLTIDESLIVSLIKKIDIDPDVFTAQVEGILKRRPKVSGGEPFMGVALNRVLTKAEDEAGALKDSYVSFLSLLC